MTTALQEIQAAQLRLTQHPIFSQIKTIESLCIFMETHVYAVWDFMTLLKCLQFNVSGYDLPWKPSRFPSEVGRLINEIVTGEETDIMPDGTYLSHFELYLKAMEEVGADTNKVKRFVNDVEPLSIKMPSTVVPAEAAIFMMNTMNVVYHGHISEVAAWFLYGREAVIPNMFRKLLDDIGITEQDAPLFHYYVKRHIEVDGNEHGPAAQRMLDSILEYTGLTMDDIKATALEAIEARIKLWDSLSDFLDKE